MSESASPPSSIKPRLWRDIALVGIVALMIVGALTYAFHSGSRLTALYSPLIDSATEIQLDCAHAHLRFEEILGGDEEHDIEVVWAHLDGAASSAKSFLTGGVNLRGRVEPLTDETIRSNARSLLNQIVEFRALAEQRHASARDSGVNVEADTAFDSAYERLSHQVDAVRSQLGSRRDADFMKFRAAQGGLIVACVILSIVIGTVVVRSDRRRWEDLCTLTETANRFDAAVKGSTDGFWDWPDVGNDAQWWSPRCYEMLGYSRSDIVTSTSTFESLLHPDDRFRVMNALKGHLDAGAPYDVECRLRTQDGDYPWFRVRGRVEPSGHPNTRRMSGSIQDITELKHSEETLRESETRYRQLFDTVPDAIMIVDGASKTFTDVNESALRLYGYSREEFLSLRHSDISADLEASASSVNSTLSGGHGGVTNRYHHKKDGTEFPIEISGAAFRMSDREVICNVVRDISARRRAEERIDHLSKIKESLLRPGSLEQKLKRITDEVVATFDADFARIWITKPGDRCDAGCAHASITEGAHVCRFRERCLHLMVSSGHYTHTDGEVHRRVPFGCYKIGRVASGAEPGFLTNNVTEDRRVHDREWAKRLGLVAFAGYQLTSAAREPLGVLALFSKREISPEEDVHLAGLADAAAQVIWNAKTDEALRQSEANYRTIFDTASEAIFIHDMHTGAIVDLNQSVCDLFGYTRDEMLRLDIGDIGSGEPPYTQKDAVQWIRKAAEGGPQLFEWMLKTKNGELRWAEVGLKRIMLAGEPRMVAAVRDISARKKIEEAVRQEQQLTASIIRTLPGAFYMLDEQRSFVRWNSNLIKSSGYSPWEIEHMDPLDFFAREDRELIEGTIDAVFQKGYGAVEANFVRKDGKIIPFYFTGSRADFGGERFLIGMGFDNAERKLLQMQLLQAQKLEAIGQLAAGIAHEINTPTQFVSDNTRFLKDSFDDLLVLREACEELLKAIAERKVDLETVSRVRQKIEESDIDYLSTEIPTAIDQSLEGISRIAEIVRAMKEFSHSSGKEKTPTDLNRCVRSTVTVARNEWKYVADIVTELDPDLAPVPSLSGELNQVILNIVVNAAHAIGDTLRENSSTEKGTITVETRHAPPWAEITIRDTGTGIPEEIRHRVFDPFFTTKGVGKGTGQGLAIARHVVVEQLGGELTFETETGRGTTFHIRLPLEADSSAAEAA